MELKLTQELASIYQYLLFLVFLDRRKAYTTMDQYQLLITLEGYGAPPWLCGILETFWDCQQVFLRQNGFHGLSFHATRGTMQGRLVYLILFNVVVEMS